MVKTAIKDLLHVFFPHICTGCGSDVISNEKMLCLRCMADLPVTNFTDQPGNPVEQKFYGRMPVRHATSSYYFAKNSVIENLIYQLKYRGNKDIGFYLGKMMGEHLSQSPRFQSIDAIIPLPLNKRREKMRGYNQAAFIANGINTVWDKPVWESEVIRKVYTETQTKRDRISRWENMKNVFAIANPETLRAKHLLLVDDVITTGASLEACGMEMLKVEGVTISVATLAYTN